MTSGFQETPRSTAPEGSILYDGKHQYIRLYSELCPLANHPDNRRASKTRIKDSGSDQPSLYDVMRANGAGPGLITVAARPSGEVMILDGAHRHLTAQLLYEDEGVDCYLQIAEMVGFPSDDTILKEMRAINQNVPQADYQFSDDKNRQVEAIVDHAVRAIEGRWGKSCVYTDFWRVPNVNIVQFKSLMYSLLVKVVGDADMPVEHLDQKKNIVIQVLNDINADAERKFMDAGLADRIRVKQDGFAFTLHASACKSSGRTVVVGNGSGAKNLEAFFVAVEKLLTPR